MCWKRNQYESIPGYEILFAAADVKPISDQQNYISKDMDDMHQFFCQSCYDTFWYLFCSRKDSSFFRMKFSVFLLVV